MVARLRPEGLRGYSAYAWAFQRGGGAKLKEVVETFKPQLLPEFWPALLMLASRMQKEEALEECARSPSEVCVDAVAATVCNHEAVERLRTEIEREVPEGHHLLGKAEGRTLVEAPGT
ncbi:MAG: hypothetical protein ACO2PN_08875 [Pyrobaculum sp.]